MLGDGLSRRRWSALGRREEENSFRKKGANAMGRKGGQTGGGELLVRRPHRADDAASHGHSVAIGPKGFTLIELLVVVSVVALLIALLVPALQRSRKQAQAVVCQSRLRQSGLSLSMYVQESDGRLPLDAGGQIFWFLTQRGHPELTKVALCPSASKPSPDRELRERNAGDTFHAYRWLMDQPDLRGSYGHNRYTGGRATDHPAFRRHWFISDIKRAGTILVLSDSRLQGVMPADADAPPESDGGPYTYTLGMSKLCINRHNSGINMLFMDWSVRKVGLKELWTLKWHPDYDTAGQWTTAGGAQPEDWPEWMRKFQDY